MNDKYAKAKAVNVQKIVETFIRYFSKEFRGYFHNVIDMKTLPKSGKYVTFSVDENKTIYINFLASRSYRGREIHIRIPENATFLDGTKFSCNRMYDVFYKGISEEEGPCEIIFDEGVFDNRKYVWLDGKEKQQEAEELNKASTSLYFFVDEGVLTVELINNEKAMYNRALGKFLKR